MAFFGVKYKYLHHWITTRVTASSCGGEQQISLKMM